MFERVYHFRDEDVIAAQFQEAQRARQVATHAHNWSTIVDEGSPWATRIDALDDDGNVLASGWSFCSPYDNPSRAKGRLIARGRLHGALVRAGVTTHLVRGGS